MSRSAYVVLLVLVMVAVVAGLDVLFLRHQFWLRLLVNIAVVAAFLAFYVAVLRSR